LQPRDFYDIVWLISQNIKPDLSLLKPLKIKDEKQAFKKILNRYQKEVKPNIKIFKKNFYLFF
jgi:hypothetical protein